MIAMGEGGTFAHRSEIRIPGHMYLRPNYRIDEAKPAIGSQVNTDYAIHNRRDVVHVR